MVDLRIFSFNKKNSFFPSIQIWVLLSTQDEETGASYQHKGRNFKVPLVNYLKEDANLIGSKTDFSLSQGDFEITALFLLLQ